MDIEGIKKAKGQCEFEIEKVINNFIFQSGCSVSGVNLVISRSFGVGRNQVVAVSLDVKIE